MAYGKPVVGTGGRRRVHRGKDRRKFSSTAGMTNRVNLRANPMRGGIRL